MAAFVMAWVSLPTATATITADACDSGDHIWEYVEADYSGYGALRYFEVEECEEVPYEHTHYFIQGEVRYLYECRVCSDVKIVSVRYDDTEMGEFCMISFNGR